MRSNVTMRDIANKLGVSSVTVSKALNDKDGVSEELKEKIKLLAEEMGYRFNTHAKSIKDGLSYNLGIVIPERFTGTTQSFYLQFYQMLTKILDGYHYSGILYILGQEDEDQLILPRIYNEKKVDGFIILGQIGNEYVKEIQKIDSPVIFLDFYTDQNEIDSVLTDNFFGGYEITNYLVENGHKKIAYVGNIYATSSIQDRFLGYYKSLLEHRIELRQDYIIYDRDERGKYIDIVFPDDMPTAFVCNNDEIAYNLINNLQKNGYQVPEDCSVVGFDNSIFAALTEPLLTTVEVNIKEMSKAAVKIIMEKLHNPNEKYGRTLINGKIIHRNSVKKLS
ncbi:LacI family DNA-binding transcriptional regulator [Niallia taxi]|uniref:LacI family transcriptional regulator n=3 Tax=Bacillati TaxID=1783272 RepID=A0A3S3SKS1_9BACI|nr:LacI family DNA-binding transcriptional regulator [Niallia taxi]MCM3217054.1 LacI family DNA-binding transcriptional regulator [Niallia taxi]MDK8642392.1 LacI family DNA-binding transcriptional regulator [Niallia taxi]MED4037264.1 LacI family DNA-binding transcriptional regulator [Niallia taxi]MED4054849.1 LacI family DNA-binding transcriptional regulator [Niallia taxi]MED4121139.1 LacI family DNA-binding transcriptional regulator [Niallia taxi]